MNLGHLKLVTTYLEGICHPQLHADELISPTGWTPARVAAELRTLSGPEQQKLAVLRDAVDVVSQEALP